MNYIILYSFSLLWMAISVERIKQALCWNETLLKPCATDICLSFLLSYELILMVFGLLISMKNRFTIVLSIKC